MCLLVAFGVKSFMTNHTFYLFLRVMLFDGPGNHSVFTKLAQLWGTSAPLLARQSYCSLLSAENVSLHSLLSCSPGDMRFDVPSNCLSECSHVPAYVLYTSLLFRLLSPCTTPELSVLNILFLSAVRSHLLMHFCHFHSVGTVPYSPFINSPS